MESFSCISRFGWLKYCDHLLGSVPILHMQTCTCMFFVRGEEMYKMICVVCINVKMIYLMGYTLQAT